eukprot:1143404-Pelagomonas_calceolata.AAC.3
MLQYLMGLLLNDIPCRLRHKCTRCGSMVPIAGCSHKHTSIWTPIRTGTINMLASQPVPHISCHPYNHLAHKCAVLTCSRDRTHPHPTLKEISGSCTATHVAPPGW